ncbi:MAG: electron transport complex subunit RsxC [Clostridia bacterium]|nr:electron transport complex subunit RsxC [Clostridia bacterium]
MALTFKGGLHIPDRKLTSKLAVKDLPGTPLHYFPINQHKGAPLSPTVKVGDYVKVGQKLADTEEFVAAPVHSSVSGTVKEISPHVNAIGIKTDTIVIENDEKYEIFEGIKPVEDIDSLTTREMLWIIRDAGLIGLGGAGFPTHVKLNPPKQIEFLIINGAECEPYITSDHRRMLENPSEIIEGAKILMKLLNVKKAHIGVEANKRDAIDMLRQTARFDDSIIIDTLKTKYPQGAEKQLIKAITGRNVPTGKIPADVGAVVVNTDTVFNIWRAFKKGMPVIDRIITVSGDAVNNPGNFRVPLGVSVSYMIEQAGGFKEQPQKIIIGGPMMGFAQYTTDVPVAKTTSAIVALLEAPVTYDEDMPCIRCGKCVHNCPMSLMPNHLNQAALDRDVETAMRYNILDCIECGLCSYTCPARKNMLQNISAFKPEVMKFIRKGNKNGK